MGSNIVSSAYITKMTYADQNNAAGTGPQTYVYCQNGLYDPDITGVGHQPRGFDQLEELYTRYYVYAARFDVTVLNAGGSEILCVLNAWPQVSTGFGNLSQAAELPWTVSGMSSPLTEPLKLSLFIKTDDLFGCRTATEADYAPQTNANPAKRGYFRLGFDTMPSATGTMDAVFLYRITYYVRWDERRLIAPS